jgi:hypothetical protein
LQVFRFILPGILLLGCRFVAAQELPYFVTYSHTLEEPGNLEIENKSALGKPRDGNRFVGSALEFEYGVTGWWTSELYLEGQTTANEATTFTGFRLENRFRPLMREHWINPVLYAEFEDINGANKSLLEVVGHDSASDLAQPVSETRFEKLREAELKLILSSNARGWNFYENMICEKNLSNQPWEFGYALAAARPLTFHGVARPGALALQNFIAGVEMYGGLGDRYSFGLHDTSHYVGPTITYALPRNVSVVFSPNFGLNSNSLDHIYRIGLNYEVGQVFARAR